ncbi:hypothetical protein CPJ18_04640 [Agrobacterium rosae]|uniref:Lytic murein transglycosylase n=1 Tax=Agrobacterium rosae TaxID=1972867 RepID=A0AAE5VR05_9HYPH|nr:hypothetical protein DXM21_09405 [Agrobacterium rosae]KAA3521671.1 hypothetical protein DXM25_08570 [Agrobacterium rosae]MQB48210.1 hypothetical protein [Agrobacterium rosae]POO53744.1 hypothetical protein CPJ18_04640 [Agrobacterium rosae]
MWGDDGKRSGLGAPICPAGHLPHRWGDRQDDGATYYLRRSRWTRGCHLPISPPVGEMPGRAEGGEPHP